MHLLIPFFLVATTAGVSPIDKVAVIDFATPGLAVTEGKALSDNLVGIVAAEIARLGHNVVSTADINAMLSLEKQKELMGCSEISCLAEIGGALGADLMVSGSVGKLGDVFSLTMTLVDPKKADTKQRFQGTAGTEAALGATAKRGVAVLFGKSVDLGGTGMMVVRTVPHGGTVFLDGKAVGTEPVTLDEVVAGDHELTAAKGSLKGHVALALTPGGTERVSIQLNESTPVKVKIISSPPDARVLIDGKEEGNTPLLLTDVNCGERHIRIELNNHVPYERVHDLSCAAFEKNGEQPFRIEAKLARLAKVQVVSTPPNAQVLIDGKDVGRTPIVVSGLNFGEHTVRIELANHQTYERTHTISAAEAETKGDEAVKIETDLPYQLDLAVPIIFAVSGTSAFNSLANQTAAQFEVGTSRRWFEGTLAWLTKNGVAATVRVFVYHGLLDIGIAGRAVGVLGTGTKMDGTTGDVQILPFVGGGLSLGKGFDFVLGTWGVRLEAYVVKCLSKASDNKVDVTTFPGPYVRSDSVLFPVSLGLYWRL